MRKFAALSVHLFTALGVVFGFLALIATIQDDAFGAFVFLAIALLIDGIDGTFARWAQVKTHTPNIDGVTLDNVIDFFTYAIIPATMVVQWQLVPGGWALASGAAMLLASCYTYANANIKTTDAYFVGFPAIWNLVVLYLLFLNGSAWASPWANLGIIGVCVVLSFIPLTYVHPLRVRTLMPVSILATLLWFVAIFMLMPHVLMFARPTQEAPLWVGLLVLTSLYFGGISLWRSARGPA